MQSIRPGSCGGKPHVAWRRVKVQHVAVWHERMGMTPEEIGATYPTLSPWTARLAETGRG